MDQRDTFPSTAYQAARDVLDRTMGRPKESIRQEVSVGTLKELSDGELAVYAAGILARLRPG